MASSLRKKAARGVLLIAILKVISLATARASALVLPFFLAPTDFGIFALATFFSGFLALAADLGISTDLVRRKENFEGAAKTAFTLQFFLALGLLGVSVPVGILAAQLYGEAVLTLPIIALSLNMVVQSLAMVPRVQATRNLDFVRAAVPDNLGKYANALITVAFAVVGFAFWSPVYGAILGAAVGTAVQLLLSKWRPSFAFSLPIARSVVHFGQYVTLALVANFVARSVDNAVVGLLLGVAPVGFYVVAYSWSVFLTGNLSGILSSVSYPVLSRLSDAPDRLRRAFSENLKLYSYIAFWITGGLVVFAPTFIVALYGLTWLPAVLPMQILAPVGLLIGYNAMSSNLLFAVGRSRTAFIVSLLEALLILVLVALGTLAFGLPGASSAVLLADVGVTGAFQLLAGRAAGMPAKEWTAIVPQPLIATVLAAIPGVIVVTLLPASIGSLFVGIGVFSITYLIGLQGLTRGRFLREIRDGIRHAVT